MKVLVIGASGKLGTKIVQRCVEQEIAVRAMVRRPEPMSTFQALGVEVVEADLESDFDHAFDGCDTVVFTAGSGPHTGGDKTLLIDLYGSIRAVENAEKARVKHFVMVSSLKAHDPLRGPVKIRHYLVARKLADERMSRSSLHHCILRPGRLLDEPATGHITGAFDPHDDNNQITTISRDDVADTVVHVLRHPLRNGAIVDMIHGDLPLGRFLDRFREE